MTVLLRTITTAIALTLFIGCSSAPKQQVAEGKTLVVGRVMYSGSGIDSFRDISLNGNAKQQINLIMEPAGSMGNNIRSGKGGLFFALVDAKKTYTFTQFKLKRMGEGGATSTLTSKTNVRFFSGAKGVTNIGTIAWIAEREGDKIYAHQERTHDHGREIEEYFKEQYPDSPWSVETWYIK